MTARDLHLPVAAQPSLDSVVDLGVLAESCGYDRVWTPETWGRDAVTVCTRVADETEAIGLGTSIIPVYSRSPALVGQSAATLQEASDGRFRVGIGPSGPAVVQHWHGESFDRPLRRTREYVEIIRAVLDGQPVDYDGEIFSLDGFRLRCEPPTQTPSIDVAGMGPKAVELAGRFADGWHALMFTPDGIRDRLDDLTRGASLGERQVQDIRVTLVVPCAVADQASTARELARQHVAFYIGGMGTFYRDALSRQGYEQVATRVHKAWTEGNRDAAVAAVHDDLLEDLVVAGTPDDVHAQIAAFDAIDGVDGVAVSLPRGASGEQITRTIETLGPANERF